MRFSDNVLRDLGPSWHPYEEVQKGRTITDPRTSDFIEVALEGVWRTGFNYKEYGLAPEDVPIGSEVEVYGHGFGHPHHGLRVNDKTLFYRSPEEELDYRAVEQAKREQEKQEKFEQAKPQLDARFDAMPEHFQERVQMRRDRNPNFRRDYEAYEMAGLDAALAIAS